VAAGAVCREQYGVTSDTRSAHVMRRASGWHRKWHGYPLWWNAAHFLKKIFFMGDPLPAKPSARGRGLAKHSRRAWRLGCNIFHSNLLLCATFGKLRIEGKNWKVFLVSCRSGKLSFDYLVAWG
jgi:hypothetical protein